MIASSKVTDKAQRRWELIVERFRKACVLHKQENRSESQRILKEELPTLIKAWMHLLPLSLKNDAKADLRDMFAREQALVDQGFKLQKLFKETLVSKIIPKIEARIAAKYRALYISSNERRREQDQEENRQSWVNPSYSRVRHHKPADSSARSPEAAPRVKLHDISGMIDSIQEAESGDLSDAALDLDDIVLGLHQAGIDPLLSAK